MQEAPCSGQEILLEALQMPKAVRRGFCDHPAHLPCPAFHRLLEGGVWRGLGSSDSVSFAGAGPLPLRR